jgi:hypothetical protein
MLAVDAASKMVVTQSVRGLWQLHAGRFFSAPHRISAAARSMAAG